MFSNFTPELFAASLLTFVFVCGFALWFFYERREAIRSEQEQISIFHCLKCGILYSLECRPDVASCPRCKFTNSHLKF